MSIEEKIATEYGAIVRVEAVDPEITVYECEGGASIVLRGDEWGLRAEGCTWACWESEGPCDCDLH